MREHVIIYFDDIKKKTNIFLAVMSSSDKDKAAKAAKFLLDGANAMLEGVDEHSGYPDGWISYWQSIRQQASSGPQGE